MGRNGAYKLTCNPKGFSLRTTEKTKWLRNGQPVAKTLDDSDPCEPCIRGRDNNDNKLSGHWSSAGMFQCEQGGITSNTYIVERYKGENIVMLTN